MATKYNAQMEDSEGNVYLMTPDLLDTKEALSANTKKGKAVDAMVVKELNNNMTGINVYVGSDGKIHFKNSAGADTALNFNPPGATGTFLNTNKATVNCGFRPKAVACINLDTGRRSMSVYYNGTQYYSYSNAGSTAENRITITNTGFTADFTDSSGWTGRTIAWFAIP